MEKKKIYHLVRLAAKVLPSGLKLEYRFVRYRLEAEFAAKRKLNGQATWWFGSFYAGHLDEI